VKARTRTAFAVTLLALAAGARAEVRVVAAWPDDLDGPWRQRAFAGETGYRAAGDDPGTLVARAEGTASALYREIEIDLRETPYLQWSWRVDRLPAITAPETEKAGDDYGARIYVVKEGFFGKLSARALNYVWSRRMPQGDRWTSAFTGSAILWSVQSGTERTGEWITHTRDVRADWQAAFGERIATLDGVALMTDADNSASRAAARYGSIRFCSDPACGD